MTSETATVVVNGHEFKVTAGDTLTITAPTPTRVQRKGRLEYRSHNTSMWV